MGGTAATDHLDVVTATSRLVAASSQNPGEDERAVAAAVDDICLVLGLPPPRRVGRAERPNLVVEIPFHAADSRSRPDAASGPRLGLCGHLDTKPVGAGSWTTDPLIATEVEGELRGRGVVDMKGAIAAMLLAAADLSAAPPGNGMLVLVFCADEENGATYGAKLLAETAQPEVDAMVIGEPGGIERDWDRLHVGSRGICNFDIDVTTSQGHSGLRDLLGMVSATEVAAQLVVDLRQHFRPPHPPGGQWKPTLNPGVVLQGGVTYGVLPGSAHVASECRLVPGMTRADFEAALHAFVAERVPPDGAADVTIRNWIPAATVDADHPVIEAARRALADLTGETPPDDVFPATTDATWFAQTGIPTLPAVGPGLIRQAHTTNEAVSLVALGQARGFYRNLVRHYWRAAQ
jgi:succinyl-diaminopimelate desuccinylase